MNTKANIMQQMVCLQCRHRLDWTDANLSCPACEQTYPLVDGVPVVMPSDHLAVQEVPRQQYSGLKGLLKRFTAWFLDALPQPNYSYATAGNVDFLASRLPPESVTLLVGGGIVSYGNSIERLPGPMLERLVNLEIKPGPVVDLVGDGHTVPFPDEFFDLVVSQAVLEHVRNPGRMVAEMTRLVKPGGWVFVDVPFMQPVHMHSDFWRYSMMGLEEMLQDYEKVRSGVNAGVASATALITGYFWATALSFGNKRLYSKWGQLFPRLLAPLKYLDAIFGRYDHPPMAPSSIYFIGRKKTS